MDGEDFWRARSNQAGRGPPAKKRLEWDAFGFRVTPGTIELSYICRCHQGTEPGS